MQWLRDSLFVSRLPYVWISLLLFFILFLGIRAHRIKFYPCISETIVSWEVALNCNNVIKPHGTSVYIFIYIHYAYNACQMTLVFAKHVEEIWCSECAWVFFLALWLHFSQPKRNSLFLRTMILDHGKRKEIFLKQNI